MKKAVIITSIGIPFLWLGFILAISFMEAPLKFTAPGIDIKLGVGIGRIIFQTMNKIELFFLAALFSTFFYCQHKKIIVILLNLLAAILLYQTFYLLPELDKRAIQLLNGTDPGPSSLHFIYIILDAIKVFLLISTGIIQTHHETRTN
ncbi:MAG: hypothetical protein ACK40M_12445 [Flavobacteriales bacterium]